ncbi:hypothetical protein X928_04005 [Petrotoga miotherma DSM 10691]|uniref:Uncharacterized protein n=1 Tax=Petrotoga miotherma DSM 10691 TaxID=1434326 RepID=A0A2K1PDJ6_9BACT|nr:hypothetical protein X928_04005 [Petrotoga miotherma DSM 10691]
MRESQGEALLQPCAKNFFKTNFDFGDLKGQSPLKLMGGLRGERALNHYHFWR